MWPFFIDVVLKRSKKMAAKKAVSAEIMGNSLQETGAS